MNESFAAGSLRLAQPIRAEAIHCPRATAGNRDYLSNLSAETANCAQPYTVDCDRLRNLLNPVR
jgi:hypothetical protein